jgi:hypothetical protein
MAEDFDGKGVRGYHRHHSSGFSGSVSSAASGAVADATSENVAPFATIAGQPSSLCTAAGVPFACCTGSGTGPSCIDNTGLDGPLGMALDSIGNIYVANQSGGPAFYGSVTVYPSLVNSTGTLNESPIATIVGQPAAGCTASGVPFACCTGAFTGPSCVDNTGLYAPSDITVDSTSGKIYVVNSIGGTGVSGSIEVFPALGSSTGALNESPIATIAGQFNSACTAAGVPYSCCSASGTGTCVDNTGLSYPYGVILDAAKNIWVVNYSGGPTLGGSVTAYSAGANGNATPFLVLTGTNTDFDNPYGLAFDPSGDLLVANDSNSTVTVYSPPLVSGDPTPALTIATSAYPAGVTNVQLEGQQLTFVANYGGPSITVYDSSGNLVDTLAGSSTGLVGPVRVVVIPAP